MSQLDFEKEFQERLKERKMEPSKGSWEKLQKRLDNEKKPERKFWWYGIAASLVGGMMILGLFYQYPTNSTPAPIVDVPEGDADLQTLKEPALVAVEPAANQEEEIGSPKATGTNEGRTELPEPVSAERMYVQKDISADSAEEPVQDALAEATTESGDKLNFDPDHFQAVSDTEVEALLADALAELDRDRSLSSEFSDEDIEALLAAATEDLNREYNKIAADVAEADELLQEVERELETSFRERIFEVLKENLQKTRTAIANRNN